METAEKVMWAQADRDAREIFIKENLPFSSLTAEDDNGEEIHFEAEDKNTGISETAIEIYSLKAELELFGISFF